MVERIEGIVVRLHGRLCYVESGAREYECGVRGRLKQGKRKAKSLVAVGDEVIALLDADGAGAIEEVKPRRTELIRHTPHSSHVKHVLAANVEQMFAVIAADQAEQSLTGLDKLLAAGVMQNLTPIVRGLMAKATGINHMMLRDPENGQWVRLTSQEQIEAALNAPGAEEGKTFWIHTKDPDVQAASDLLNRAIGKPVEEVDIQAKVAHAFKWISE